MLIVGVPSQGNVRLALVWSGKVPTGMCLVGKVSVGDVSGRGNVRRGSVRTPKIIPYQSFAKVNVVCVEIRRIDSW